MTQRSGSQLHRCPRRKAAALFVLASAVCTGGCASEPGVVFTPAASPLVWPTAPDQPRIRYVGALVSSGDLKPARSGLDALGDALFGREISRGMINPMGVCTDGADRVFVADSGARGVHVFDLATQKYAIWQPGEDEPQFRHPVAVAYDGQRSRLLLSDAGGGMIWSLGLDGKVLGTIGAGILKRPCGIAVEKGTGRIAVADVGAHQIVLLSPEGTEVSRFGGRGSGQGQLTFPTFVALDASGRICVSDSLNFRLSLFAADGTFQSSIGRKGDLPGYFSQPKGVAADSENHLYVVDANFEAVQLFDAQGSLLMAFGREGRGPGEFWLPAGIWIDPADRIWIADSYNRRIQVFQYLRSGAQP